MRTAFVVLALVLATPAYAEQVGVVVTGEATLQPQVASEVEVWLHTRGRTVSPAALEPSAINTLIDCFVLEDLGCARGLIDKRSKATSVIYARIDATQSDDGTRQVEVTGYWFQKDHEAVGERRVCAHCTDDKLHDTLDDLMLALVHAPPLPAAKPAVAAVDPVGTHEDETVAADAGAPRKSRVPLGLAAAGGIAIVTGGIMLAIDEDPTPRGPQQPRYLDTATAGAVMTIAGAAALGTGIYLWMHERTHGAPVAAVSHDGAVVGWTGRF
jgi:hypothetical protein